jgi:hypothetical protein
MQTGADVATTRKIERFFADYADDLKNHLKQFGLALHNYENVSGRFPPGYRDTRPDAQAGPGWGCPTFLLPFLEQTGLHTQIDPDRTLFRGGGTATPTQPQADVLTPPAEPALDLAPFRGAHDYAGHPRSPAAPTCHLLENLGYAVGYCEERKDPLWVGLSVAVHMLLIGVPIALFVRAALRD